MRARIAFTCAAALSFGLWAARAQASDFWDEVRNPGLAAHRALLAAGRELLLRNRADGALARADEAIARLPELAEGHVLRGRALAALGREPEALLAYERALALAPDALDGGDNARSAAETALHAERPALASAILGRSLAHTYSSDRRSGTLALLGDALQAEGPDGLRRAIAVYREALAEAPDSRRALLGLALALHRGGEREQALVLAQRAPGEPEAAALPPAELAARRGLWLLAIADEAAAAQAFAQAAALPGPWQAHARASSAPARGNAP